MDKSPNHELKPTPVGMDNRGGGKADRNNGISIDAFNISIIYTDVKITPGRGGGLDSVAVSGREEG